MNHQLFGRSANKSIIIHLTTVSHLFYGAFAKSRLRKIYKLKKKLKWDEEVRYFHANENMGADV